MKTALNFVRFALSHVKPETVPKGAVFPVPASVIGTEPWEYLYGTTGHVATQALLDAKYNAYYATHNWTRAAYDYYTANWPAAKQIVCDCQGLLDKFLGVDVSADIDFNSWCTDKGELQPDKHYDIGEAFFIDSGGRKSHVGWVVGYTADGEEIIEEERGLRYGCVMTRRSKRPWTHHGKPTKVLDFSEPIIILEEADMSNINNDTAPVFELTSPMQRGDDVKSLQRFLNETRYRDAEGFELTEDGKCGRKTIEALTAFVQAHAELITPVDFEPAPEPAPVTHTYKVLRDGEVVAGWEV